jgi:hypothetical protein
MGLKVYLVNKVVDDLGKEHRHQNSHHDKQDGADGQDSWKRKITRKYDRLPRLFFRIAVIGEFVFRKQKFAAIMSYFYISSRRSRRNLRFGMI